MRRIHFDRLKLTRNFFINDAYDFYRSANNFKVIFKFFFFVNFVFRFLILIYLYQNFEERS